jgi:hypothetical protein
MEFIDSFICDLAPKDSSGVDVDPLAESFYYFVKNHLLTFTSTLEASDQPKISRGNIAVLISFSSV